MDEEDSQDELINKNASHGKGKRPATSILSDEEENSCDDSQEGATDSEDDDDDDAASVDGEDEGAEEEDDEDSEHEDMEKGLEGAVGSTSTDLAGLSSDEDAEKCPICLNSFHEQPVATPESCGHYFCLDCILEWAKNANSCPVDRIVFSNILLRKCYGGKVQKTITVQKSVKASQEEQVNLDLEQTSCEVCGGSDREDRLLLCDGCDAGYHMECLTPPLDAVPVEEWFCPECAADNRNTRREQSSEDEHILPTTSHSQPGSSRPIRAIARTQHSERVRANVNRHRITQARTAAQIAPRYLMQSTWLDETINAVVAGLNTAVYVRDLTPRPRSRRRRKTAKRRKTKKEGKAAGGKTSNMRVKRRKRKVRRSKSRKKVVVKKETTARSRIARSLGIKKPVRSSSIPSVYRPSEQTLGSMRADIGAASLSIYGDPFDLDPFDDEEDDMRQASTPSSLLEAKRRGLSRSALRSHQPVARPISAGLPRRGHSIPQLEEVAEAAPVPDLLGSILSGQSMLLMDSSDVVINRDGSLKATKPVNLSLPRSRISSGSTSGETSSTGASSFQSSRQPTLSSPSPSLHSSPHSCPTSLTPVSPSPISSHVPLSISEHSRFHPSLPKRPEPSHLPGNEHSQWGTCGIRDKPSTKVTSGPFDSDLGDRGGTPRQHLAKKLPPKPVWVDVSGLPRIPKIKRESSITAHGGSSGSSSNNLPESSMTNLAGDKGRQHTVDQQGENTSRQSRTVDSQRQRLDRTGSSSSFSNSFSTPSSSANITSSPRASSSSISFRINASGNPWHARRLSLQEPILPPKNEESTKRAQKDKQMLLLSHSQAKKTSVKSEVYDPFNPTGSDSSESEVENDCHETNAQSTVSVPSPLGQSENMTEHMELDSTVEEESPTMCVQVKKEPVSFKEEPWSLPSQQLASGPTQILSGSLAAVMSYSGSPAISDAECSRSSESSFSVALDRSRSNSTSSSHHSDMVKIEVKAEPEGDQSPVKPKSEPEVHKGNGLYDEVPSVASIPDKNKSMEKEMSTWTPPQEDMQSGSASPSPRFKNLDHFHKAKKQSEDRKHSCSRSPIRRRSRSISTERNQSSSRSKEKRRSRSRSKEKRRSRSRSKEKRRSRSRSKEKRRSRSRSKEKRRSRSRSKEKRRSRSRSKEKRRSRSRSKEKRRSRSRSKEKRRSRSRSKEKRRARSRSKEKRRARSRSKEKRRARSRSKEKRRSRSRSKEKRRSRSRSKEKRRSRSRSKERRHSYSQDRRRSTRSSSNESRKKKKAKCESHERYDGRGKDGHKKSKDKRHSRSRSTSRSRERKREQPSTHNSNLALRGGGEMRLKRSRSTSRDRKRKDIVEGSRQKEKSANIFTSIETEEPNNKNELLLKEDTESHQKESCIRISDTPTKESELSSPSHLPLTEESMNLQELTEETTLVSELNKQYEIKQVEIKQESIWLHEEVSEDIKQEMDQSYKLCDELKKPEDFTKEEITTSGIISQEFSEVSFPETSTHRHQSSYSLLQDEKNAEHISEPPNPNKIEQIWPDDDEDNGEDPYSDNALVINLCPTGPASMDCEEETHSELTRLHKEELEVEPLRSPCQVKQEPVDSSDEDINVDYLIDNLDFIKKEMNESSVTDPAGDVEPQPVAQEDSAGTKQEMESVLVITGTKAKSQGKRVTWNIQEPEGPQPEKISKLALFKLKLKQEGSRKVASMYAPQSCSQETASAQVGSKPATTSLNPSAPERYSNADEGESKSTKEEPSQDFHQKDKYMKKLHMQERAIEEVKLAIKPFYQKRDITKEEYKEILRKAVQKVCHSKSGEINPVKVANLVKAYVDKYKHARKHHKGGSLAQSKSAEGSEASETPG